MKYLVLSIHPRWAEEILEGRKTVEIRKSAPTQDVKQILLYATAPVCKVIGLVDFAGFARGGADEIWCLFGDQTALTPIEYSTYASLTGKTVALSIRNPLRFGTPMTLADCGLKAAPRTYGYVRGRDLVSPPAWGSVATPYLTAGVDFDGPVQEVVLTDALSQGCTEVPEGIQA